MFVKRDDLVLVAAGIKLALCKGYANFWLGLYHLGRIIWLLSPKGTKQAKWG